jgi:hypothetical protein
MSRKALLFRVVTESGVGTPPGAPLNYIADPAVAAAGCSSSTGTATPPGRSTPTAHVYKETGERISASAPPSPPRRPRRGSNGRSPARARTTPLRSPAPASPRG